jgi:hypothetical protein
MMTSTPPAVIREAYERNFGLPVATLPAEEALIERRRRDAYEGRDLVQAITNDEPVGWKELRTFLSDTNAIAPFVFFAQSLLPENMILSAAHVLAPEISGDPQEPLIEALRDRFSELSRKWHEETDFLSSPADVFMNFNYQQIIGMGPAVLPLIIEELAGHGGRWFWALRAITGADPVPEPAHGRARQMRQAWLDWWEQNG